MSGGDSRYVTAGSGAGLIRPGDCWKVTRTSVRSRFETASSEGHQTRARWRGFFPGLS